MRAVIVISIILSGCSLEKDSKSSNSSNFIGGTTAGAGGAAVPDTPCGRLASLLSVLANYTCTKDECERCTTLKEETAALASQIIDGGCSSAAERNATMLLADSDAFDMRYTNPLLEACGEQPEPGAEVVLDPAQNTDAGVGSPECPPGSERQPDGSCDERDLSCLKVNERGATIYPPAGLRIIFQVSDCDGKPVRALRPGEVQVINDVTGQPFGAGGEGGGVSAPSTPSKFALYTVLSLDMSGSIFDRNAKDAVFDAAQAFVDAAVVNAPDGLKQKVAIQVFGRSSETRIVQDFTNSGPVLTRKINELRTSQRSLGSTNLYGAYRNALTHVRLAPAENAKLVERSVVIFTDGVHEAGDIDRQRRQALDEKSAAEFNDTTVFSVYLGDAGDTEAVNAIRELASQTETGFRLASLDDLTSLTTVFTGIAENVKQIAGSNYVVGVCTPVELGEGKLTVTVKVGDVRAQPLIVLYDTERLNGDTATCDPNLLANPCDNRQCGAGNLPNFDCGRCVDNGPNNSICEDNQCVCEAGLTDCEETCARLSTDVNHCGECGNQCSANAECIGGQCSCSSRFTGADCDGCAERFSGPNCMECANPRFRAPDCEVCTLRFSGPNCNACASGFAGVNCERCAEGYRGEFCEECDINGGYVLRSDGACTRIGPNRIGEPCSAIDDCNADADRCLTEADGGPQQGICTKFCVSSFSCPNQSECVPFPTGEPDNPKICMKACSSMLQCAGGEICLTASDYDPSWGTDDAAKPSVCYPSCTTRPVAWCGQHFPGNRQCKVSGFCECADARRGGADCSKLLPGTGGCMDNDDCAAGSRCVRYEEQRFRGLSGHCDLEDCVSNQECGNGGTCQSYYTRGGRQIRECFERCNAGTCSGNQICGGGFDEICIGDCRLGATSCGAERSCNQQTGRCVQSGG